MWFILIASMVIQLAAQRQQAKAAAEEAEFQRQEALANAAQAEADAKLSAQTAEAESVEARMEGERIAGSRRVAQGASGGRTDVGTNFLIRIQDAARVEWEVWKTGLSGAQRTNVLASESSAFKREADQIGRRISNIRTSSQLSQANTILGGFNQGMSGRA